MDLVSPRSLVRASALLLALALLPAPRAARAQTWSEPADAGSLVGTAQVTVGTGTLTMIQGQLATDTDVDVYCIDVVDPAQFFAGLLCSTHADPDLSLFAPNGQGLALATSCAFGYKGIPAGFVPGPGTYYLAVSGSGGLALSGAAMIWLPGIFPTRAPDGPGVGGALTGWGGSPARPGTGVYTVNLAGVSACSLVVPSRGSSWGILKVRYR